MTLFGAELLSGQAVAVAGPSTQAITAALEGLGAEVHRFEAERPVDEQEVGRWASEHAPLRAVVHDARSSFGRGGADALTETVQRAWLSVREVAVGALIEASKPGKAVLIAPAGDAGRHAQAVGAALENLARTISVEWARYGITSVLVAPASEVDESQLAELVAFLCSPAADYLSGCRLELGALSSP